MEGVEECREVIAACAQAITPQGLRELRSLRKPPAAVQAVLEAVAVLLGVMETSQQGRRMQAGGLLDRAKDSDIDFREVKKCLQGSFSERLACIDPEEVTASQARRLRKLLAQPGFDEELIRGMCPVAVPLTVLCRAIGSCLAGPRAPTSIEGTSVRLDGGLVVHPDITRLRGRELQQVLDLTVSRAEVGGIVFHGMTDCTDLDLAALVHLDVGEVLVYPNGVKPPVGQELNKRATVTMYQCWPPNGHGHLEDPGARDRYRAKIKQMTEDKNATFVDYDCTTGVWKFEVEHF